MKFSIGRTRGGVFSEQLAAPSGQGMCYMRSQLACVWPRYGPHAESACSGYGDYTQVNEEKAALESRLTSEQEYLDNQLQKKVCCW